MLTRNEIPKDRIHCQWRNNPELWSLYWISQSKIPLNETYLHDSWNILQTHYYTYSCNLLLSQPSFKCIIMIFQLMVNYDIRMSKQCGCGSESGPWFNIKMPSYQYRKSHCGDKTVVRSSYLHNGISYTGKMTSLYWIKALVFYPMWQKTTID